MSALAPQFAAFSCCFLAPKMGFSGPTVVSAIHKSLISTFLKRTKANNPQIYTRVITGSIYIPIGNNVISYFRSAANCINIAIWGHVLIAISR